MNNDPSMSTARGAVPTASDEQFVPGMFLVSVTSLLFLSGLLHLNDSAEHQPIVLACCVGYLGCCLVCSIEAVGVARRSAGANRTQWLYCLFPPLRMGARDRATATRVWLPRFGWQVVGRELDGQLDRISSVPMIVIALMVLPLMAVEYNWPNSSPQIRCCPGWQVPPRG